MNPAPLALLFFVLVVLAGIGIFGLIGYRQETVQLRREVTIFRNAAALLNEVLPEIRLAWEHAPHLDDERQDFVELARAISDGLPRLVQSLGPSQLSTRVSRYQFRDADFANAQIPSMPSQVAALLEKIDDPDLTALWRARRIPDLMAMLRRLHGQVINPPPARPIVDEANPLLAMLRTGCEAQSFCDEVKQQVEITFPGDASDAEGQSRGGKALLGVVEAVRYRRDKLKTPFTLGAIIQSLSPRGIESLYRECRTEAEEGRNGWPPQYAALRSYVESQAGWDGRLPMSDRVLSSHAAYVSAIMRVLLNVR